MPLQPIFFGTISKAATMQLRRPISWSPEIHGAYAAKNEVTLDRFVCGRNGIARHVVDAAWTYIGLLAILISLRPALHVLHIKSRYSRVGVFVNRLLMWRTSLRWF